MREEWRSGGLQYMTAGYDYKATRLRQHFLILALRSIHKSVRNMYMNAMCRRHHLNHMISPVTVFLLQCHVV